MVMHVLRGPRPFEMIWSTAALKLASSSGMPAMFYYADATVVDGSCEQRPLSVVGAELLPTCNPHPSSVERRSRGKWLQTAPQEPK